MRKTMTALIGAATTAMMIGGAGAAAASPSRAGLTSEHFQEVISSLTSNRGPLVAYGAFTASGTDVAHSNSDHTFKFPGGSFLVIVKAVGGHQHIDKSTCLFTATQLATYKISHGTGKYAGISGSGHATLSVLAIVARDSHGACSMSKTPHAQQTIIRGQGPVTLP
jgi:hypothetical protein